MKITGSGRLPLKRDDLIRFDEFRSSFEWMIPITSDEIPSEKHGPRDR